MKKASLFFLILTLLLLTTPLSFVATGQDGTTFECPEGEANLTVALGNVGRALEITVAAFDDFMALCPNITVEPLEVTDQVTERLTLYTQFLGTQTSSVDIYQIDVIWPAILAEHMIDMNERIPTEVLDNHFQTIIENNTVDGKLVGVPWYSDVGVLYYRSDLLEKYGFDVPTTWTQLEEAAQTIQEGERAEGNNEFWGYVWQGDLGEPTTISSLEWQASSGGGVIVSPDGEIQVNNRETIDAIERAANWVGSISPPNTINHRPEDSRSIWQAGNAAFMRNWPYAYRLGNEDGSVIQGLFDIAPLPAGEGDNTIQTGVLGGWQLAVSQYSEFQDAAVALVLYMTSPEVQKTRALELGNLPTVRELYEDPEVLESLPFFDTLTQILDQATARPSTVSGEQYSEVSRLYYTAVYSVLSGQQDARTAMEDLEFDLEDLFAG